MKNMLLNFYLTIFIPIFAVLYISTSKRTLADGVDVMLDTSGKR